MLSKLNIFTKAFRQKTVIGYVILALGLGYAVWENNNTLNESKAKGLVVRGVICTILRENETEAVEQAKSPIVKKFGIPQPELEEALEEKTKKLAAARAKVAPSTPSEACDAPRLVVKDSGIWGPNNP